MTPKPRSGTAARPFSAGATRRGLWSGLDQSSVMAMELVAGILTWTALGWLADRWLGTAPWLLGVGAMLGFAGGLYLVWLRSSRMEGYQQCGDEPSADVDAPDRTVRARMPASRTEHV